MDNLSFLADCALTTIELSREGKTLVLKPSKTSYALSLIKTKLHFDYLLTLQNAPLIGLGDIQNLKGFHEQAVLAHFYNPYKAQELFVIIPYAKQAAQLNTLSKFWPNSSWFEFLLMQYSPLKFKGTEEALNPFNDPDNRMTKDMVHLDRYKAKLTKWEALDTKKTQGLITYVKKKSGKVQKAFFKFEPLQKRRENLIETGGIQQSLKNFETEDIFFFLASLKIGIEKQLGITPHEIEQALWILGLEYARITSHLKQLVSIFQHHRIVAPFGFYRKLLTEVSDVFSNLDKEKLNFQEALKIFRNNYKNIFYHCKKIEKDLLKKREPNIFKSTLSYAPFTRESISEFSVTGILAKSAGFAIDMRKSHPFYFYQDLKFEIPLGLNGSVYDRYKVLKEEIIQSIHIVYQVVESFSLESSFLKTQSMKTMIQQAPAIILGELIEKPSGLTCSYLYKNIKNTPETLKIRLPGFNQGQFLTHQLRDNRVSKIPHILTSLAISPEKFMS